MKPLLLGYSVHPTTGALLPPVNAEMLERCRIERPRPGISSTPCERIDIRCRQAGISGPNDGLWLIMRMLGIRILGFHWTSRSPILRNYMGYCTIYGSKST